jgi:hypothetical protein
VEVVDDIALLVDSAKHGGDEDPQRLRTLTRTGRAWCPSILAAS